MKPFTFISIFVFFVLSGHAQTVSGGLSYNYLNSKPLDQAIQSYNFSRVFLENKQPLFIHGIGADITFLFKNMKSIKHGLSANYSYFGSKAINTDYNNSFNLHFINLNYVIRLSNELISKNFSMEIHSGLSLSGLYRRWNGGVFLIDELKARSFGIGGNTGVKIDYCLYRHGIYEISPFIFFGFTPFLYAPKNESVINATQKLVSKPYIYAITSKIGIVYKINLEKGKN